MNKPASIARFALLLLSALLLGVWAISGPAASANPDEQPKPADAPPPAPADRLIPGLCYSPFRDGQDPRKGHLPSEAQLKEDLAFAARLTPVIRYYSVAGHFEKIPEYCLKLDLDCHPGAWIDRWSANSNEKQLQALIRIGKSANARVKSLVVGNEALHRNDLKPDQLIEMIRRVKAQVKQPVTTAETFDIWMKTPQLADAADLIMVHIYPYWEAVDARDAAAHTARRMGELKAKYPGKRIILAEAGWPSAGEKRGQAIPSPANQALYFRQLLEWAKREKIDLLWFELFDEKWKDEPGLRIEANFGLITSAGAVKPELKNLLPAAVHAGLPRPPVPPAK